MATLVTSGLRRLSPLVCTWYHAAVFVMNAAALLGSQWQVNRFLAPSHQRQVVSIVFQVFGMTDREANPTYQLWRCVLSQLYHLGQRFPNFF